MALPRPLQPHLPPQGMPTGRIEKNQAVCGENVGLRATQTDTLRYLSLTSRSCPPRSFHSLSLFFNIFFILSPLPSLSRSLSLSLFVSLSFIFSLSYRSLSLFLATSIWRTFPFLYLLRVRHNTVLTLAHWKRNTA